MVRLNAEPKGAVLLQVYTPTNAHSDEEVEEITYDAKVSVQMSKHFVKHAFISFS